MNIDRNKLKPIKYFPIPELVLFVITTILILVVVNNFNSSIWLPILLIIGAYFSFLGRANLIYVTEDKIKITFLSLIGGHSSIELKNILKIGTYETYDIETAIDAENSYYLFTREYNLEFLDDQENKRVLNFKINNRKKEIEIINRINNAQKTN